MATDVPVFPVKTSEKQTIYNEIGKYFKSQFGTSPNFYARVPGRVNLIGEHIDYCGYAVLPMAIEQDIILAVSINTNETINLVNFDSEIYERFSSSAQDLNIDTSSLHWYNYFLCGYKGIAEKYDLTHRGLDVVVKGTIPPSSGLSSSSALVCASALATAFANRIFLTKMEIASLCAVSERYIGTEGGGMDQAIGFLAEPGTAKLIDFNPLTAVNVPLPKGIAFVVSNSCVPMNKAATSQYNIRVVECRLATKILAKVHGFDWRSVKKLADVPVLLGKTLTEMKAVVESCLPRKVYSRTEVCAILEITETEFISLLSKNTDSLQHFKLSQRAQHVFQEAARVLQFKSICDQAKGLATQELGKLMNESHKSCRDLYECSHPELDELVTRALEAGAIGARLTGAGWGGCCISLVMENQVPEFLNTLKKKYYEKENKLCQSKKLEDVMFRTRPSGGAAVFASDI